MIELQRFHCTHEIWLEKMTEDLTATGLERPVKGPKLTQGLFGNF
ncbi:hypothetical protein Hdeb2414_s0001g00037631 [Helianthus debilis subsp. tardiflorus]